MTANGNGLWKTIAVASFAVNITGLTAWITLGMDVATEADLDIKVKELNESIEKAIATAPYPWISDRNHVLAHINSKQIHETDDVKRNRIREELTVAIGPISKEISFIREDLREVRAELKALGKKMP